MDDRSSVAEVASRQSKARVEMSVAALLRMKAPYNPRKIDPAAMEKLRASLRDFGPAEPVTVNRRSPDKGWGAGESPVIVGGHQRVEAAHAEGWEWFPVFVGDWGRAEEIELNVALNNPNLQGRFDDDLLRAAMDSAQAIGSDLVRTGFGPNDLVRIMQITQPGQVDPDTVRDVVPQRCADGDIWSLGSHRLACGDSTDRQLLSRLFDGSQPSLCVTDPPYGVEYDPNWRNVAAAAGTLSYGARRVGLVANDDRSDWSEVWRICGCDVIYAWSAAGGLSIVSGAALEAAGYAIRAQIIWKKSNFPISRGHYTFRHEPCWYAVREGATAHWIGPKNAQTVWEVSIDPNVPGGHSTQKPVELFRMAIANHAGDVFEPFCGSGTCLIACQQLGRRCFAVEIVPHYCDVILARWEAFTGDRAQRVHQGDGSPVGIDDSNRSE